MICGKRWEITQPISISDISENCCALKELNSAGIVLYKGDYQKFTTEILELNLRSIFCCPDLVNETNFFALTYFPLIKSLDILNRCLSVNMFDKSLQVHFLKINSA